jgi:peroxiredoxin Q/BCP
MGINPELVQGQDAPEFTLESDDRGEVSLAELLDEGKLLLYFYPKDMTSGCTTQATDFRDNLDTFQDNGWQVVGVSPDSVERHAKFREKEDLNFTLLSDPDHEVAEKYGVYREKTNYGKKYMGIVRSTFLIDEDGTIQTIQDNVRATGHVSRLLRDDIGQ